MQRDAERKLLAREAYDQLGGVGGALAQHAEETLTRIGDERLPIVRELFRNLVTAQGTRAVREVDELLSVFDGKPAPASPVRHPERAKARHRHPKRTKLPFPVIPSERSESRDLPKSGGWPVKLRPQPEGILRLGRCAPSLRMTGEGRPTRCCASSSMPAC